MTAGFDWFRPDDLPFFFKALRQSPKQAVLVGGQSLTFWVDFFGIPIPETETPALTQDADVFASRHDAAVVAEALSGHIEVPSSDDHTPNTAIVTYQTPDGRTLNVDFMGVLIGLNAEDIRKTAVVLEHPNYGEVSVLHPTLVLKSRCANLHRLKSKRDANGIEQARLAVQVMHRFFEWYVQSGYAAPDPERYLLDRVQWLKGVALSDDGVFVFAEWGIDVMDAAPYHLIKSLDFHTKQKLRIAHWVAKKRGSANGDK